MSSSAASQVEGKGGFTKLANKVRVGGPTVLFHGALAASGATFVGHWPWFFVVRDPPSPLCIVCLCRHEYCTDLCLSARRVECQKSNYGKLST